MAGKRAWVKTMSIMLRRYRNSLPPFSDAEIYADTKPWDNDNLNAKIDIERALEAGCKDAEAIVDFLCCVDEGWFFEDCAEIIEILDYTLSPLEE